MKDSNRNSNEPNIQSVSRAAQILKCFQTQHQMTLTEIGKAVGLHKSTAYGIVTTLKNEGFLAKDENSGYYRLGMELYHLASCFEIDLRKISMPYINELCSLIGETVNLVVPDDNQVVYIEKCESRHSIRISTSIGTRLPMYCTAVGKAILAYYNNEEIVSSILDRTQFVQYTTNTMVDKNAIMEELKVIRQRGYSIDNEELEKGLICIAAPVLNVIGFPVAAVSCSGPIQRMDEKNMTHIAAEVTRVANRISALL